VDGERVAGGDPPAWLLLAGTGTQLAAISLRLGAGTTPTVVSLPHDDENEESGARLLKRRDWLSLSSSSCAPGEGAQA
jgi:hypothetical protein